MKKLFYVEPNVLETVQRRTEFQNVLNCYSKHITWWYMLQLCVGVPTVLPWYLAFGVDASSVVLEFSLLFLFATFFSLLFLFINFPDPKSQLILSQQMNKPNSTLIREDRNRAVHFISQKWLSSLWDFYGVFAACLPLQTETDDANPVHKANKHVNWEDCDKNRK